MGIIGTIFIGLIVGLLARFIKPGDDSMGWIMTILLGIAGSLLATYGGQALGIYQAGEAAGFFGALVGAVVLLVIYLVIRPKPKGSPAGRRESTMFGKDSTAFSALDSGRFRAAARRTRPSRSAAAHHRMERAGVP